MVSAHLLRSCAASRGERCCSAHLHRYPAHLPGCRERVARRETAGDPDPRRPRARGPGTTQRKRRGLSRIRAMRRFLADSSASRSAPRSPRRSRNRSTTASSSWMRTRDPPIARRFRLYAHRSGDRSRDRCVAAWRSYRHAVGAGRAKQFRGDAAPARAGKIAALRFRDRARPPAVPGAQLEPRRRSPQRSRPVHRWQRRGLLRWNAGGRDHWWLAARARDRFPAGGRRGLRHRRVGKPDPLRGGKVRRRLLRSVDASAFHGGGEPQGERHHLPASRPVAVQVGDRRSAALPVRRIAGPGPMC